MSEAIRQLTALDVTFRLMPIFREVAAKFCDRNEFLYPVPGDAQHFVQSCRQLIDSGLLRIWEMREAKAILGGMFFPDIFTGQLSAWLCFWGAAKGCSALPLLSHFERVARREHCRLIYAAAL